MERFKRSAAFVISGIALLSYSQLTRAGEGMESLIRTSNDGDSISVKLAEVTVTGKKTDKGVTSSMPVYQLSSEEIEKRGIKDISEALRRLPGINIRDLGGAGGMKTVSVRGLGANHTGVLYDGVALSDCQGGSIDLSRYSIDALENLKLTIGDASDFNVTARAVASAATLNLETRLLQQNASSPLFLNARLTGGSFGYIHPYISTSKAFSNKVSAGVSAEFTHALNNYPFVIKNGIQTSRERRSNSLLNSGHADFSFSYKPTPESVLLTTAYWYDSYRQLPGQVVLYNPISHESLKERNIFGQIKYNHRALGPVSLDGIIRFNWDTSKYRDEDGKYPGGIHLEDYFQRETYVSAKALWSISDNWKAAYAADYTFNDVRGNLLGQLHPMRHSILQVISGQYANSWITLTGRLLWSYYSDRESFDHTKANYNRLSPSASLIVRPFRSEHFYLRAGYKNIFRMPTFNDIYYFRLGSRDLLPERTNQYNLGLTWQNKPDNVVDIVITSDLYFNTIRDKIVAIPKNMFIWTVTNLGKATAYGADFSAALDFTINKSQSLAVRGNYSYQRVASRTDRKSADWNKQMAYTPLNSGATSISWNNPWISPVFSMTASSARYGTNANIATSRVSGYADFSFSLSHNFNLRKGLLRLEATCQNIFDKQYCVIASYPMPGRRYQCTIGWTL